MATQLQHVMGSRTISRQALAALLKIQQRHFHLGRVALARHPHENMLDVQATVLPASFVHTGQGGGQLFEQALMHTLAVLFAATGGVPVFNFVEAVEGSGNQQCLPVVLGVTTRLKKDYFFLLFGARLLLIW